MGFGWRKRFPVDDVRPVTGQLAGAIAGNSLTGKPLGLEHDIAVELAPFQLGGQVQETRIKLFGVPLAVRSWRELAGRDLALAEAVPPILADGEPVGRPGQVRGSIELLHQHLAVRATRIAFGAIAAGAIAADLAVTLELAAIRYAPAELPLSTALVLAPVRVLGDITRLARPPLDEARELAARFLDLADYELRVVDGVVSCVPVG